MLIKELISDAKKAKVAETILRDLPAWFGLEDATKEYIEQAKRYPMFVAFDQEKPVGFYSLREENADVLDMYVLGVLKAYHHQGVGTALQKAVDQYAKEKGYSYLMVLTLAKKANNKEYLATRAFYLKMGFIDFYQNDAIFDPHNPCQILLKKV